MDKKSTDDVFVKIPLNDYIELNDKLRRYDKVMRIIDQHRSRRGPRMVTNSKEESYDYLV